MSFKPLKAATPPPGYKFNFPVLVSPKIDGIRIYNHNGLATSASKLTPVRNIEFRVRLSKPEYAFLDGEGVHGLPYQTSPTDLVMSRALTGINTIGGTFDNHWYVFDDAENVNKPFEERLARVEKRIKDINIPYIHFVEHVLINNQDELDAIEAQYIAEGYEGGMVRDPRGRYKYGRSTLNEAIVIKLKRFVDEECTVVGYEEQVQNQNEATINNYGHTVRSSHQDNLVPKGTLGKLVCQSPKYKNTFGIGTGLNDAIRQEVWDNQEKYLGKTVTFKHQSYGVKDRPRQPVFKCFREHH